MLYIILRKYHGLKDKHYSLGDDFGGCVSNLMNLEKSVAPRPARTPRPPHACFPAPASSLGQHWESLTGPPHLGKHWAVPSALYLQLIFNNKIISLYCLNFPRSWILSWFIFLSVSRNLDLIILLIISIVLITMFHLSLESLNFDLKCFSKMNMYI